MTHFWAIRTDTGNNRPYIWSELQSGRLRQGWSRRPDEDLEVIEEMLRIGGRLTAGQKEAWRRNRLLIGTQEGGVAPGDYLVLPHLPTHGLLTVVVVNGAYRFSIDSGRNWLGRPDFGNILPVKIVSAPISRYDPSVSHELRRRLRPRQPMWRLDQVGREIELLVMAHPPQ